MAKIPFPARIRSSPREERRQHQPVVADSRNIALVRLVRRDPLQKVPVRYIHPVKRRDCRAETDHGLMRQKGQLKKSVQGICRHARQDIRMVLPHTVAPEEHDGEIGQKRHHQRYQGDDKGRNEKTVRQKRTGNQNQKQGKPAKGSALSCRRFSTFPGY